MERHQSNPSRRQFLTAVAGTGGAMLLGSDQLRSADVDPRVAQIVSKTIAVDMHNHLLIPYVKDAGDPKPNPDLDLAGAIRRSGLSALFETLNLDGLKNDEVGVYYKYHLQALAFEDEVLARNHMRRALNMKDLQTLHDQGQPTIIQTREGAQFVEGHLDRIEEAYKRGLRGLQLVHTRDDLVSPMGDIYTAPPKFGGLTPFGAQVIKECNRLGILIDLGHGTVEMGTQALKVSTKPMVVSHGGLSSVADRKQVSAGMHGLLFGKEYARAVADAGGVVGVWFRLSDTLKEYVGALKEMVDAAGIDHVGLGTDSDIVDAGGSLPHTNAIWPDQGGGFFYAVAGEMLKQGFTPDEVGKIGGGNFCRVFAKATDGHA